MSADDQHPGVIHAPVNTPLFSALSRMEYGIMRDADITVIREHIEALDERNTRLRNNAVLALRVLDAHFTKLKMDTPEEQATAEKVWVHVRSLLDPPEEP